MLVYSERVALEKIVKLTLSVFLINNVQSRCSGMLARDPRRGNDVDSIFDRARQAGAVERPTAERSSRSKSFTGRGRLLLGEGVGSAPQPPESVNHTITFWQDGFTVDDGPLRRLDDPTNAPFLEVIVNFRFLCVSC